MGSLRELERRLLLMAYLARHPRSYVAEVAAALKLDEGEVRKLVEQASMWGKSPFSPGDYVDIEIDHRGCIRLHHDQALGRPLRLTTREGLALSLALRALIASGAEPWADAARTALDKLKTTLVEGTRDLLDAMEERIAIDGAGVEQCVGVLSRGLDELRAVDLSYWTAGRDQLSRRRLRTYAVVQRGGLWYAAGHDSLRDELRIFRLDRVREATLSDERYRIPADFDVERLRRAGMTLGGSVEARIRFLPPAARLIEEELAGDDLLEHGDDGSVVVRRRFVVPEGMAGWVLSFGGLAEVLEPESLRRAVAERARLVRRLYG